MMMQYASYRHPSSKLFIYLSVTGALFAAFVVYRASISVFSLPHTTDVPSRQMQAGRAKPAVSKRCIFRDSELYQSVYVYPSPNEAEWATSDLVNEFGKSMNGTSWPWIAMDETARENARGHYNIGSQNVQYTTELLVRELMVNPDSCLRTNNPETASLFYVPYLPSIEHHKGTDRETDYSTSPYGQAIMDIVEKEEYSQWEKQFGLSSAYWKRRGGSDHILVFSEPMHGLYHPRNKRGNFHFIHSQKQLNPPIVISVELSTTFVDMYPSCAAKNILVPYPNTHGSWFNGAYMKQTTEKLESMELSALNSEYALETEKAIQARPIAQYYNAGNHGTCTKLRRAMKSDYGCSPSAKGVRQLDSTHFSLGMQISTFCPCPGGDSPSAKRMFDSLIAGCIPIVLSEDFVWPFTREFDKTLSLEPADFSIRLNATDFDTPLLDEKTCKPVDPKRPGMQAELEAISPAEIARLRKGVKKAGELYSWYSSNPDLPENPLQERVLPDGGTAHFVVQELAKRAKGERWPACEKELKEAPEREDPRKFKC